VGGVLGVLGVLGVRLIRAGNPSEWTGPTGNNTWLLPGAEPTLIDAGVGNPQHIDAIARALAGATLSRVLVTHGHRDHVAGLPALRERWPDLTVVPSADADKVPAVVRAGDRELEVLPTPGHAPDHLCFFDRASGDLFCGDLARRNGTVVIPARTGGDLRAYLESLRRVRDLRPRRLLPGHGPVIDDPIALLDEYLAHRAERERQIVQALADGAQTVDAIVARVYPALSPSLRAAATETVEAHLAKLRSEL
jgi:glyoxylase-like metal-dependent hydrolase (beta-lactamase superfamily II)